MEHADTFTNEIESVIDKDGVTILQIQRKDGLGNGVMTHYDILPGITMVFSDFHMQKIKSNFVPNQEVFCMDHCREGRIEQEVSPGIFRYVGTKDIRLDNRKNHATNFFFPLSHYHGITIQFEMEQADKSIKNIMPDFPTTIREIRDRYCKTDTCSYLRSEDYLEHIFTELYQVPVKIKKHYMIVKVLELLLRLWNLDDSELSEPTNYYGKSQTDKVKEICDFITEDLQSHYTVEELAERFQISSTTMKNTFKGIYGKPIYRYLLEKRMEQACKLLLETEKSIIDIAVEVGYETPSKFSAAFKKTMNLTPRAFRNREVRL